MHDVFSLIQRLAPHARVVLLTGETGTGKELAARAFHQAGPRQSKPFVTINCSAVVDALFESELFGHVRGAFTGAVEAKAGLFEAAHGGTLFLDEIGELPLSVQAKLLRALELGEVQRVGSLLPKRVDVTVIAASNRDLREEVAAGRFRGDLFYRLNVVEVALPPLRERREDIPYLTAAFVRDSARRMKKTLGGLTSSAERILLNAPWDGNVRELKNVIERACMLADGSLISERELAGALGAQAAHRLSFASGPSRVARVATTALGEVERQHIIEVLKQVKGNRMAAARLLKSAADRYTDGWAAITSGTRPLARASGGSGTQDPRRPPASESRGHRVRRRRHGRDREPAPDQRRARARGRASRRTDPPNSSSARRWHLRLKPSGGIVTCNLAFARILVSRPWRKRLAST